MSREYRTLTLLAWVFAGGVIITDRMGALPSLTSGNEAVDTDAPALAFNEASGLGTNLVLALLLPAAVALCATLALRIRQEDQR